MSKGTTSVLTHKSKPAQQAQGMGFLTQKHRTGHEENGWQCDSSQWAHRATVHRVSGKHREGTTELWAIRKPELSSYYLVKSTGTRQRASLKAKTHTCKFAGLYKNTIRATDQRTGLTSKQPGEDSWSHVNILHSIYYTRTLPSGCPFPPSHT